MNKKFSKSFLLFLCLTLSFFVVGCKKNNEYALARVEKLCQGGYVEH